jgi:hypothetical protein
MDCWSTINWKKAMTSTIGIKASALSINGSVDLRSLDQKTFSGILLFQNRGDVLHAKLRERVR